MCTYVQYVVHPTKRFDDLTASRAERSKWSINTDGKYERIPKTVLIWYHFCSKIQGGCSIRQRWNGVMCDSFVDFSNCLIFQSKCVLYADLVRRLWLVAKMKRS